MNKTLQGILDIDKEVTSHYVELYEYINNIIHTPQEKIYYRKNQQILYIGIINRLYSLWESYNKQIAFQYFLLLKAKLLETDTLIKSLKLHELPAYITETGMYSEKSDSVHFKLKEEFVTYTSKNLDASQLNQLFSRFGIINLSVRIMKYKIIKDALDDLGGSYDDISKALKWIIDERNAIAHQSSIDVYIDLEIICSWIKLLNISFSLICKEICIEYISGCIYDKKSIGVFVKHYKSQGILAVNIAEGITITKETLIYIFKQNKLVDILQPVEFQVDDVQKEYVTGNDRAGIKHISIFNENENITDTSGIYLLSF